MKGNLSAVLYARVSTEDQAENGTSLDAQEASCRRKAGDLGALVIAAYRDEGISGALYQTREGLQKALTVIETGQANLLLVYSISRLSRDVEHQQAIKKRIERASARLIVCDMPIEDTEEGDLMFGVSGAFAQYERRLIRKRTMAGSRRQAENGKQPCRGRRPFGYVLITEKHVLRGVYPPGTQGSYTVLEEEAVIVRDIFARCASGASLWGISERLNRDGVPTPKGGACWRPRTIKAILENPIYKGQATYGLRATLHDESRKTEHGYKHDLYQRVKQDGPLYNIPAPMLVSEDTWQECQRRLRENRTLKSGNPGKVYLLSGYARCPVCRRGLAGRSFDRHAYYVCNNLDANAHRPQRHFPISQLETDLTELMMRILADPDSLEGAYEADRRRRQATRPVIDAEALRHEITELEAKEKAAILAQVEAIAKGRDTSAYDCLLDEIDARRSAVRSRLAALETLPEEATVSPLACALTAQKAIEALHKVLSATDVLSVAKRREVIGVFIREIVPVEDGLRVLWLPFREDQSDIETTNKLYTYGWLCTR